MRQLHFNEKNYGKLKEQKKFEGYLSTTKNTAKSRKAKAAGILRAQKKAERKKRFIEWMKQERTRKQRERKLAVAK